MIISLALRMLLLFCLMKYLFAGLGLQLGTGLQIWEYLLKSVGC